MRPAGREQREHLPVLRRPHPCGRRSDRTRLFAIFLLLAGLIVVGMVLLAQRNLDDADREACETVAEIVGEPCEP